MLRTADSDQGRWAPNRAHAVPSRTRWFDRSTTASGMSLSEVAARKLTSSTVGPPSLSAAGAVLAMNSPWWLGWAISLGQDRAAHGYRRAFVGDRPPGV